MWKKTKKNKIPNPPSRPPGFRTLLPFPGAVVEELEPVLTDSAPLSVVEDGVGVGNVDIIGIVVSGLTREVPRVGAVEVFEIVVGGLTGVVLEVGTLGVVGIAVEGLARVVPGVGALEVVEIVVERLTGVVLGEPAPELAGTDVMSDPDMVDLHSVTCKSQVCPGSQHPRPHGGPPGHNSEQRLSGRHSYPFLQQPSPFGHLKYSGKQI